ncbi:MAG: hypothetical protein KGJ93_03220 [Patescibacteria group bacterium]|nr:hypothetical protein [Patescibacteria group bacterium]
MVRKPVYWRYKNTILLLVSLAAFFALANSPAVKSAITSVGSLGLFGVVLTGILFVSIFTAAPAAVILFFLAKHHSPVVVALYAGFGAVIGDYLIFRYLKNNIFTELHDIFNKLGGTYFSRLFSTPYFSWALPILGAAIIASPLPDEVGITMMGLSRVKNWQFAIISFTLNTIGIFFILTAARTL